VFREEAGRLTASLVRLVGDFDLAEEVVSEAVVEALERWPRLGVPDRPAAWLLTTARNKALDRLRRDGRYREKLQALAGLAESAAREPDDRMRLIFTCCHPALDRDVQVALTLRAVVGLTTAEIARAFLVPDATLAKRLTRAKQKIVAAGIPYRTPEPEEMQDRLDQVLRVVYLVFNEGFFTTAGPAGARRELVDDAEWLAALLAASLPSEPEPLGLLAVIRLHASRWRSRLDEGGRLVLLADQDRSLWDRERIASGVQLIERAAALGRPGPYQIEAAIAAVHCDALTWEATDWPQLLQLYTMLAAVDPSPVVRLSRAVVLGRIDGPAAALEEVDRLGGALEHYHLFHATRAALLRDLGRPGEAHPADEMALRLTSNPLERELLGSRLL
jgi:RNA polymerase sigma factor (sigma-70 family)